MRYRLEAEFELMHASDYQFITDRIRAALKNIAENAPLFQLDGVHFRKAETPKDAAS